MRVPKEFAIILYGLAVGFGFFWLMGFAIGYPNPFVPLVPFGLGVGSLVVAWRSDH